jgi:NAD(P)-dependent dehydrogenase (short-subunit alcohol dehydrogenase family)
MRARRSGRTITISYVPGVSAAPGLGCYVASKHAAEGFSESFTKEVAEHGILVTLVEPGLFRTNALGAPLTDARHGDACAAAVSRTRSALSSLDGHQPGEPARIAAVVLRLAASHVSAAPGAGSCTTAAICPRLEQRLRELDEWAAAMATAPIHDNRVPG